MRPGAFWTLVALAGLIIWWDSLEHYFSGLRTLRLVLESLGG